MALTINITPDTISSAYRPIPFKVTSDDNNIVGIRGDLYVGGTYTTTIDGIQKLGTDDEFNFDVRKVLQSILKSEIRTNITTFKISNASDSSKTIKIRFFEILEISGVFTTDWARGGTGTGYIESSDYDVVNSAIQLNESISDWTVDDATKKLLTVRTEAGTSIPGGVPFQIGFISASNTFTAESVELDEDLNPITTTTSAGLSGLSSSKGIIEIPASLTSSSNTKYIDITLKSSAVSISLKYRFKVVSNCNVYPVFIQNHLGCFDHFNFGAKVVKNVNTTNQNTEKPLSSSFGLEDYGAYTLRSVTNTRTRVITSSLSSFDLSFLSEFMINHTVVYTRDDEGNFYRKIILSHSERIEDNDGIINSFSIVLKSSNEYIVQNGD